MAESENWKVKRNTRKEYLLRNTKGRCVYCGCVLTLESVTFDHIVPKSRGGTNEFYNCAPACANCNNLKGDSLPIGEWAPTYNWRMTPRLRRSIEMAKKHDKKNNAKTDTTPATQTPNAQPDFTPLSGKAMVGTGIGAAIQTGIGVLFFRAAWTRAKTIIRSLKK